MIACIVHVFLHFLPSCSKIAFFELALAVAVWFAGIVVALWFNHVMCNYCRGSRGGLVKKINRNNQIDQII
jgi:hypothetical protein